MRTVKDSEHSISLQGRDLALLRGLFECRVMTTAHATVLYFDNKIDAANKRLQRLKAAGLISERPRRAFEPSVLFLTRKGLMLLQEKGVLTQYPSFNLPALDRRTRVRDLTIRHGGAEGVRTPDLLNAIQALYQLSYDPIRRGRNLKSWPRLSNFLPAGGC